MYMYTWSMFIIYVYVHVYLYRYRYVDVIRYMFFSLLYMSISDFEDV